MVEAQALEVERAAPEGREAVWAVAESALDDALKALGTPVSDLGK